MAIVVTRFSEKKPLFLTKQRFFVRQFKKDRFLRLQWNRGGRGTG